MSDMHVLTGNNGNAWTVVMHFDTPAGNNVVGVPWADAVVNSGLGGTTVLPDGDGTNGTISAAEKTAIEAGTVFEHSVSFLMESGGTSNPELLATLDALYAVANSNQQAAVGSVLRYFGFTRDVP